ncbi:YfhO family protein [Aquihabitans sp. G128]|uniref:YfhO family protein n=1 Tax=Aquihabitans sp. G128 TaxID=2849779 RepID=UPI00352D5EA4
MRLPPATAEVAIRRPADGHLRATTHSSAPQLLVISESSAAGWRATVDGRPVRLRSAYGLLVAVPVPAGRHRVELRYEVEGLGAGVATSVATAAGLAVVGLVLRRRRPTARPG